MLTLLTLLVAYNVVASSQDMKDKENCAAEKLGKVADVFCRNHLKATKKGADRDVFAGTYMEKCKVKFAISSLLYVLNSVEFRAKPGCVNRFGWFLCRLQCYADTRGSRKRGMSTATRLDESCEVRSWFL